MVSKLEVLSENAEDVEVIRVEEVEVIRVEEVEVIRVEDVLAHGEVFGHGVGFSIKFEIEEM